MRPLIEAGKLYRAVTPLYIVQTGKEELYFYTEEEMDAYKRKLAEGKTENHDEEERKNRRIRVAFCLVIAAFGVFIITWGIRAL